MASRHVERPGAVPVVVAVHRSDDFGCQTLDGVTAGGALGVDPEPLHALARRGTASRATTPTRRDSEYRISPPKLR
jgi:hypothetical protein